MRSVPFIEHNRRRLYLDALGISRSERTVRAAERWPRSLKARLSGWTISTSERSDSQRALNLLDPVTFDHVADAHVLIVLEGHAAFLPGGDFPRVVLEALELRELAFVDDDVIADEAHVGTSLHCPVGDTATRDLADLGNGEDFEDQRIAEHGLAQRRREEARHRLLHVLDEIVDDVVVADLGTNVLRRLARLLVGPHVEADDRGARSLR